MLYSFHKILKIPCPASDLSKDAREGRGDRNRTILTQIFILMIRKLKLWEGRSLDPGHTGSGREKAGK